MTAMRANTEFDKAVGLLDYPFEISISRANDQIVVLQERCAALERVALVMSRRCWQRRLGFCDLDCLGRILCDVKGLIPLQAQHGPPPDPSCLEPTD